MNEDKTAESEWGLINFKTGETINVAMIEDKPGRWDRVYGKALANMLDAGGEEKSRVIAYLIRHRDYKNVVMSSIREIAEATKVSTKTVNRTLTALQDKNFIHRLRQGVIMFSPHVIRTGKDTAGLVVLRQWKDCTEEVYDEDSRNVSVDKRDVELDSVPRVGSNRFESIGIATASTGAQ